MTLIRVDPEELQVTASVLNACAAELAELERGLPSCLRCSIPPEIEGLVQQIVSTIGSIVGAVAQLVGNDANDLVNRATTAANDSLAVATSATIGIIDGNSAPLIGIGVIGGHSTPDFTITGGDTFQPSGVIGGHSTPNFTITGGDTFQPSGVIGGVNPHLTTTTVKMNSAVSPFESLGFAGISLSNQFSQQSSIDHILKPSRSEMENRFGYPLSLTQYHNLVPGGFDGFVS